MGKFISYIVDEEADSIFSTSTVGPSNHNHKYLGVGCGLDVDFAKDGQLKQHEWSNHNIVFAKWPDSSSIGSDIIDTLDVASSMKSDKLLKLSTWNQFTFERSSLRTQQWGLTLKTCSSPSNSVKKVANMTWWTQWVWVYFPFFLSNVEGAYCTWPETTVEDAV